MLNCMSTTSLLFHPYTVYSYNLLVFLISNLTNSEVPDPNFRVVKIYYSAILLLYFKLCYYCKDPI